jgi:hypothetical protein
MGLILWIIAVILVVVGIVQLLQGAILWAIILFIAAAAIGPGGWSIFGRRV